MNHAFAARSRTLLVIVLTFTLVMTATFTATSGASAEDEELPIPDCSYNLAIVDGCANNADCDAINPLADEIPGNTVDGDCDRVLAEPLLVQITGRLLAGSTPLADVQVGVDQLISDAVDFTVIASPNPVRTDADGAFAFTVQAGTRATLVIDNGLFGPDQPTDTPFIYGRLEEIEVDGDVHVDILLPEITMIEVRVNDPDRPGYLEVDGEFFVVAQEPLPTDTPFQESQNLWLSFVYTVDGVATMPVFVDDFRITVESVVDPELNTFEPWTGADVQYINLGPVVVPMCLGSVVTIDMRTGASGTGTDGDDVILGTNGDDVIKAGAGNDKVCAGSGDDVVNAGAGDDTIAAGDGDDRVYGLSGADEIRGWSGEDIIRGGGGRDIILGGDDDDDLDGNAGDDIVRGQGGNDLVKGDKGIDALSGDAGDDEIVGGPDGDVLRGGAGDDELRGQEGDDLLVGGMDNDLLLGGDDDDRLVSGTGIDRIFGGAGIDACTDASSIDIVGNCESRVI